MLKTPNRVSKTQNSVRYLKKTNNANERENYAKWWKEQIEHYGTSVTYYTNGYSLTSHNFLYGEDTTTTFGRIDDVVMLTDITNDSLMLSKFGIMADCDMTAVVHISSFYEKIGCGFEPKAGDLIQLTEYGADRPGGRSAPIYEITERDDEYLALTNPLIGHYVWYIKCKRFEYSYEPGLVEQPNNKQVSDGGDYGRLAGGENPQELFQPYPDSVQNSAKCIYDYYSEDGMDTGNKPFAPTTNNHFLAPRDPWCPVDLVATGLSAVPGPYTPEAGELFSIEEIRAAIKLGQDAAKIIPNVVLAPNTSTVPVDIDTFVANTSSSSQDFISYTTENNEPKDLNKLDGGYI